MSLVVNLGDILTQLSIAPADNVTATGNTTGVDLRGAVTANPSAATNYEGQIAFLLDVKNNSGTSPTLAIKIQDSDDDSTYGDVTGGGFTSYTTTAARQKVVVNRRGLKRYVRLAYTAGGTSPSYIVSCQAVALKKNPA